MNNTPATDYPEGEDGGRYVRGRQRRGMIWSFVFFGATMIGIVVLTALLFNIANAAFGFVLMKDKVQAATLAVGDVPLEQVAQGGPGRYPAKEGFQGRGPAAGE